MKKVVVIALLSLMSFALAGSALANNWTRLSDVVDIDMASKEIRVYVVAEDPEPARKQAREIVLSYIKSLTAGKERTSLETIFEERPIIYSKVEHEVNDKTKSVQRTRLTDNKFSAYYVFDLKLLKPILPEINLP